MFDPGFASKGVPASSCEAVLKRAWTGTKIDHFDSASFTVKVKGITANLAMNDAIYMMNDLQARRCSNGKIEKLKERYSNIRWSLITLARLR